ncbi:MAG: hypoxanthine phosphoribosyltransferase [Kiritimatiellae bacterium]|nr:hypoxanthine phosphoribosyltransferase [Kiritimatiellia bacterium]
MDKTYLDVAAFWRDCFRLARIVLDSGWTPDVLLTLWRGGAPVGLCVHEFFVYRQIPVRHEVLSCKSYTGIATAGALSFAPEADSVLSKIRTGERVLVLDDVFDSGRTADAVMGRLQTIRADARFASVYWKPEKNQTTRQPDFYVRKTEEWIVFPHELQGLTPEEVVQKDPVLAGLLLPKETPE